MSGNAARGTDHYLSELGRVGDALPASGDLAALRRQALARFAALGFPDRRDERWRYTSVDAIARGGFRAAREPSTPPAAAASGLAGEDAWRLVFVNGLLVPEHCRLGDTGALALRPLRQALADAPERAAALLPAGGVDALPTFEALNLALATDGAWIETAAGQAVARTVELVFVSLPGAEPTASYPLSVVEAAPGSALTLIETHIGVAGEAPTFADPVVRLRLAEGAQVTYHKVVEEHAQGNHIGRCTAELARDARLVAHTASLGGRLVRNELEVRLAAAGASASLDGVYLASRREHCDQQIAVSHDAGHTTSRIDYRGVVAGRGHAVYNGEVVVRPGADGTDAVQSNRNLLLGPDAEVDTRPVLEIYADEVRCAHGATVGRLDPQAMFYLRARGVDEPTARALLTFGFADELLARLDSAAVRGHLQRALVGHLPDAAPLASLL